MKQILPKEIIHHCIEAYIPENRTRSKVLYGAFLVLFLGAMCLLPFIKVKVYSSARGLVKPDKERVVLSSSVSGRVFRSNLQNNKEVTAGDTLLQLQSKVLDEQLKHGINEEDQLKIWVADLISLIEGHISESATLKSSRYQKEFIQYQAEVDAFYFKIQKLRVDYVRKKKLLEKGVISHVEYENVKLEYDLALNALRQLRKERSNTWQALLTEHENSLRAIESKNSQIMENMNEYVIIAPIDGSLVNLVGLEEGSVINIGVPLAEISPNTNIIAECYISPLDIGLIDASKQVTIQIDSYNYNQWGTITAHILEIANDVEFLNNEPVYKVRCRLDRHFLQLTNGTMGELSKGMTLNARFELTERTLFQLLFDKIEDWFVPEKRIMQA